MAFRGARKIGAANRAEKKTYEEKRRNECKLTSPHVIRKIRPQEDSNNWKIRI